MPEFAILSSNVELGAHGEFDHAQIVIGRRSWTIAQVIAIVLNEPSSKKRGVMAAITAASGAAIGNLLGRAAPVVGGSVIGAAVGAGAGAYVAEQQRRRTQAALVFADGIVVVAEVDDVNAGALLMVSKAVAAHHAQWGAPSPKALPAPDGSDRLIDAKALLTALPSSDAIAATTKKAIVALKKVDWPEIPNPFRKKQN